MFETTYLGHQGWLIESGSTRILVDPLLGDRLGGGGDDPIAIYPPRRIDLAAFPPVDAVVVTHEHPDHLNIPTLLRLDRRIPILLPRRASLAARGLLADLGFTATLLGSGEAVTVGELEIHPYHSSEIARDEWDVTPLVIRDRAGDGSLATSIDAPETADFARFAVERGGRIGLWASSHNTIDLSALQPEAQGRQESDDAVTARLARDLRRRFEAQFQRSGRPEVLLILSSGFAFTGDLAWMNRHAFPGRADRLVPPLAEAMRDVKVRAPVPGQRFSLRGGKLVDETGERTFFAVRDPREWPPHAAEPYRGAVPDYAPLCGRRALPDSDRAALLDELRGFAAHLYGTALMRRVYQGPGQGPGRGALALALRTDGEPLVLAWRPEACAFEPVACADPRAAFTAGLECWATDLLAVLRLELLAGYLGLGRCRAWSTAPERLPADLDLELSMYTHPLRSPARALEQYRLAAAALGASLGPERVAAAGAR